jgi:hypothetical protein
VITKTDHLLQVQRSALQQLTRIPPLDLEAWRTNVNLLLTAAATLDEAISRGADLPTPWAQMLATRKRRKRGLTLITRRPNPKGMSTEAWYVTCRLCSYDDHRYTVGLTMDSAVRRALSHLQVFHDIGTGQ